MKNTRGLRIAWGQAAPKRYPPFYFFAPCPGMKKGRNRNQSRCAPALHET